MHSAHCSSDQVFPIRLQRRSARKLITTTERWRCRRRARRDDTNSWIRRKTKLPGANRGIGDPRKCKCLSGSVDAAQPPRRSSAKVVACAAVLALALGRLHACDFSPDPPNDGCADATSRHDLPEAERGSNIAGWRVPRRPISWPPPLLAMALARAKSAITAAEPWHADRREHAHHLKDGFPKT